MAKDLYNLYLSLSDQDDLPEWCHYKIARSQNELEAVTNYLTSKIAKMCVDQEVTSSNVCEHASEVILRDIIREGFLDNIKGKFSKGTTKNYTESIDEIIEKITIEGGRGERYYHLNMIYEVINLLVHANKSMSVFSNIPARKVSKFKEEIESFRKDFMLTKPIERSIVEILKSAIKIKNILESVKSELRIYLDGPEMVSFRKKSNESIERSQYSSFNDINQIGEHVNSAMREIKGFSKTGMILNVSRQIKDLCGENKETAKSLIFYFDKIIDSIVKYSFVFDYIQYETDEDKAKYDNRYKPTENMSRMDYEDI
jgi:hypothetical protein